MGTPTVEAWRWTAGSFERAGEAGVFGDAHANLIDGEVHTTSPQSPLHAYVLSVLISALATLPPEYLAGVQSPVRLAEQTELEPDLYIAVGPRERYVSRHPGPEEVSLVVEVSVSSLGFDTGEKLRAYARHCLPKAWIVDVAHRQVLVDSSPEPDQGVYAHVEVYTTGSLAVSGLAVQVGQLWPPDAVAAPSQAD